MIKLPPHLTLELTAKCNYACPYCYCVWHESGKRPPRDRSTDQWKKILDRCAEDGVKSLSFSGGEPLLRKDLRELIRYAKKLLPDARLDLFTNNSRVKEDDFFFFKENRIHLSTSLQGLRSYGAMTGTRRTYCKTLDFLLFAAENNWRAGVSMTATKANLFEFEDMYAAAILAGAKNIQMGAMMPEGRGRNHLDLTLSRAEWNALKQRICALPHGDVPFSFCDEMLCICREQPADLLERFGDPEQKTCPAGKDFGVIGPDGHFRRCLHHTASFPLR